MTTKEKLARLRASFGLTQEEFGARLGISKQFISQVESGKRSVGAEVFEKGF